MSEGSARRRIRLLALLGTPVLLLAAAAALLVVALGSGPASDAAAGHETPAGFETAGTRNYGDAPSYTLTDQNGRRFSSRALAGKVQVVSYLFPYCTSFCPLTARTMKLAEDRLEADGLGGKVAFVAFNVDPGETGPAQLRAFLSEFGIAPTDPHWHYLTGSPAQIRRVVRDGFHIYYRKVSLAAERREAKREKRQGTFMPQPDSPNPLASRAAVDYDIVHNDSIEIAGPTGKIAYYTSFGNQVSVAQLVAAVRAALPR